MRNITGQAVVGPDLFGREYELARIWERLEQGEHLLMLAPRRVGKTSVMLELRRAPRQNWDLVYVDVEDSDGPADAVATILAALTANPNYRSRFEASPFSEAIGNVLARLSATVDTGVLRVELKSAIGRDWSSAADQLWARLRLPEDAGRNLLVIIDELPILISRMLRSNGQQRDAELLLSWLRRWRQAPELRNRVCTLIGGSIGLEGILRRTGQSGLINDLTPFLLTTRDTPTAARCIRTLCNRHDFLLDDRSITHILELLGDPVPYHVQLFFAALRDACQGEAAQVSRGMIEQCFANRLAGASGTAHLDHYVTRLDTALDDQERGVAGEILQICSQRKHGANLAQFEDLREDNDQAFLSVLRDLESDGYLQRAGDRLEFRSNLLREWWGKQFGRPSRR